MTERPDEDALTCAVCLAPLDASGGHAARAFAADIASYGHVLNLTRATIASPTTWQAATRSQHMFATLRRVDPLTCALVCLYTSLLNGCAYCLDDAAGVALELGAEPDALVALPELPDTESGARLEVVLRYARHVATSPGDLDAALYDQLHALVDDEELLELTAVISMKCFWNRFATSLRLPPEGRCPEELLDALRARSLELASRG